MTRVSIATVSLIFALWAGCATQPGKTESNYTPLSQRKLTAVAFTNAPPGSAQQRGQPVAPTPQGQVIPTAAATAPTQTPLPRARVVPMSARIVSVNEKLQYVIVDFTNSRQLGIDEKLSVYRVGEKVAEIKISGPYRNTTVAADIVSGEVKYGDEVKTD